MWQVSEFQCSHLSLLIPKQTGFFTADILPLIGRTGVTYDMSDSALFEQHCKL